MEAHYAFYSKPQLGLGAPRYRLGNGPLVHSVEVKLPGEEHSEVEEEEDDDDSQSTTSEKRVTKVPSESSDEDEDEERTLDVLQTIVKGTTAGFVKKHKKKPGYKEIKKAMPFLLKKLRDQIRFFEDITNNWGDDEALEAITTKVQKYTNEGMDREMAYKVAMKVRKPQYKAMIIGSIEEDYESSEEADVTEDKDETSGDDEDELPSEPYVHV